MNCFTAFSVKPLRIASVVGVITAVIGFIYAVFVVIRKILEPSAPVGYSSTMCVLLFVGGMIMMMLGLRTDAEFIADARNAPVVAMQ